jgi:putative PEP-CTERM system TPR-repeat lipoprotein
MPTAVIHLKSLLQQRPDHGPARIALGRAMLALGDPDAAEKEVRRAIAIGGDTRELQQTLVETLLAQKRFQDALDELATAGNGEAGDVRSLMLAGRALEGIGRVADAETRYRRAMAAAPDQTAPLIAMASIMLNTGRAPEADRLIDRALHLDQRSIPAMVVKGRRMLETQGAKDAAALFRQALDSAKNPQEQAEVLANLAESQLLLDDLRPASESVSRLEAIAPAAILTRYLRARVQAQSGDYSAAILGLQRILNDVPDFAPAERLLGTVHYLNGNLEQAALHISRVIEQGATDPFLGRLLAELRLQQDRPEQALQTLLPMIRQGPGAAFDQGLLSLAGRASLRLGDSASAISYFREGSAQYPGDERFRLGEISARLASGDAATARTMLEGMRASSSNTLAVDYLSVMTYLVEKDNARATTLASRLASQNPRASWAHLLLATVYLMGGDGPHARREFENVLTLEPSNKEALLNLARLDYQDGNHVSGEKRLRGVIDADPENLRARMFLAEAQLAGGRFDEALEQARQAARLGSDAPAALNLLGRVAAASGRWDEARDCFNRIVALDPGNARAWLNLARATVAAGERESFSASLQKAMEIAPRDPAVLMTAGDIMLDLGQTEAAIEYFERGYAIAPSTDLAIRACRARMLAIKPVACGLLSDWIEKNPRDVIARLFKASVHQSRDETQDAIAEYEAVLREDARQPVALNNLAWLYFERDNPRALRLAEQALEVQPESAAIKDTLGWIQIRRGDKRRGLALIAAAATASPADADIQYHLAYALAENGDVGRARKTLGTLLETAPQFPSRDEAEGLMRRLGERLEAAGG